MIDAQLFLYADDDAVLLTENPNKLHGMLCIYIESENQYTVSKTKDWQGKWGE